MAARHPLLAVVVLLVAARGSADARARPVACDGRYLVSPADGHLFGADGPAVEAVAVDAAGQVSMAPCGSTSGHVHARRRATTIRARWPSCGTFGRVTVTARIASPGCDAMRGALRRPRARRATFAATRPACGNGRLDRDEICDASAPGGDAACPGACVGCACASTSTTTSSATSTTSSSTTTTTEPDGPPIVAPSGVWTWVDFPDSSCDDGSTTGIGVNPGDSPDVLVLLGLGGACWDATTCYVTNTAAHGPFGPSEFTNAAANFGGTILDRTLTGNPFATWSLVVVPYCTGDLHAGDNVVTYDTGTATHVYHHAGHANVRAFLHRLGPTFPLPGKVVLSGISAGGFGALFNFPAVRTRWPDAQAYVLDDSGPLLESASFAGGFVASWFSSWRLDLLTDPVCGLACRSDLSRFAPALAAQYPTDRMALTSSVQDASVRDFYGLSAPGFESALLGMAADRLAPTTRFRHFFTAGAGHAELAHPDAVSEGGVALLAWLDQLVHDDPAWTSVQP